MRVSVVIGSHNGERLLADVIKAVLLSLAKIEDGELIVVDSASTDATGEIMRAVADSRVRHITLDQRGVSRARNAGWEAARHDVVLFTDDDVIVPVAWAGAMSIPLLEGYEAVAGAVHLPDDVGAGLGTRMREFLADTRDMGLETTPPRTVVGASMGLRRDLYDRGFRLDERLGPGALGLMEETLLHLQLTEAGGRTAYVGDAPVLHRVDASKVVVAAWARRAALLGTCEAWLTHNWFHGRPEVRKFVGAEARLLGRDLSRAGDHTLELVRARAAGRWWWRYGLSRRAYTRRQVPARLR